MAILKDNFGRQFYYLRLSITDICNFRCSYCLPNGCLPTDKNFLNIDEIRRLVDAFSELGVRKIRLTGGEPTTRKNFIEIASLIAAMPQIDKLAFTTNGYHLQKQVVDYFKAGLRCINISVDSLKPDTFKKLTGHDRLTHILAGIDNALCLGFSNVKINAVLLKGVNDNEIGDFLQYVKNKPISVRFIELMQTGDNIHYFRKHHLSTEVIRVKLFSEGWRELTRSKDAGPAIEFAHPDYQGRIGLISPYSPKFCQTCNRLRVSSRGALHLCLFTELGYDLRMLLQADEQKSALKAHIQKVLLRKKASHFLAEGITGSTEQLAQIGG